MQYYYNVKLLVQTADLALRKQHHSLGETSKIPTLNIYLTQTMV